MPSPTKEENIYTEGRVLLIDKPLHWTSFDVVRKVRNLTRAKTGHAGTLDPLATGLLICCTGKLTKQISEYQQQEKEYTGIFTLGAVTPTFDLESEPRDFKSIKSISEARLQQAALEFTGIQQQVPPMHSAIKKDGKPIYRLARKGIELEIEPRTIHIKAFDLIRINLPDIHFRVVCSTGTYIRSLANDYGAALGCGAYLSKLCRTRIGDLKLEEALTIEQLAEETGKNRARTDIPRQN